MVNDMTTETGATQTATAEEMAEEKQAQINAAIRRRVKQINEHDELTPRVIADIVDVLNRYDETHYCDNTIDGWANNIWEDVIYHLDCVDVDASEEDDDNDIVLHDGTHITYDPQQHMWVVDG